MIVRKDNKMKKILVLATAILLISGCTFNPPAKVYAFQDKTLPAKISITHNTLYYSLRHCAIIISIDSTPVAKLYTSQTANFYISDGNHTIEAQSCSAALNKVEINTKNEHPVKLEMSVDRFGEIYISSLD